LVLDGALADREVGELPTDVLELVHHRLELGELGVSDPRHRTLGR
jgi:hypothetical protein